MAEDKTLLKKDLALIIKINSKLHYDNIDEVKKIYQALVEKNMFASSLGQRYLKKLELIIQGKNNNTCLFCGKQCTAQSVICSECLGKLQPQNETKPQTESVLTAKEAKIKEIPVSENIEEHTKTIQDKEKKYYQYRCDSCCGYCIDFYWSRYNIYNSNVGVIRCFDI